MPQPRRKTKRKPIPRQTRHFQLRMGEGYPIDTHVREVLDYKKSKRLEVTAIRDGVRLLWALENNDLSVLWELFPHLKPQVGGQGGGGGGDDLQQIKSMLEIVVAGRKSNELLMHSQLTSDDDIITAADIEFLERQKKASPKAAAPPKATAAVASVSMTADDIASNFLSMFD